MPRTKMISHVDVDSITHLGNKLAAELHNDRKLVMVGDIDGSVLEGVVNSLGVMGRTVDPVTLIIATTGGEANPTMGIVSVIRELQAIDIEVTGRVHGYCMSAGAIILQACNRRLMGNQGILMVHGPTTEGGGGDVKNHEAEMTMSKKMIQFWAEMYAERNTSKDKHRHEVAYWTEVQQESTPRYFTPTEALDAGLIDDVV